MGIISECTVLKAENADDQESTKKEFTEIANRLNVRDLGSAILVVTVDQVELYKRRDTLLHTEPEVEVPAGAAAEKDQEGESMSASVRFCSTTNTVLVSRILDI